MVKELKISQAPAPANSIQALRLNTDFDLNLMNLFLEGSAEKSKSLQLTFLELERDPILHSSSEYYDLTKEEHRDRTAEKIARLAFYMEKDYPNLDKFQERLTLISASDPQTGTRIGVHLGLFLNLIRGNGTKEQFEYWIFERGAYKCSEIYGCFAMTEMAHGSNVPGLETTLTYDEKTRQFTVNTPHIGATKWWIGGAAHSLNYCVAYLRLIVRNKDYGVKTFVVPLRDSDHNLMPGVAVGDIGSKMGRDGIDNGWIQFTNVKIPKEYMLSKYCQIDDETGEVVIPPLEQLSYGALLTGRVTMVEESYRTGARFVTVLLRYAVGRRQFGAQGNETQLISYPLHQHRLIPLLLYLYLALAATSRLRLDHFASIAYLEKLVTTQDLKSIGIAINMMKNVFGSSASLKSTFTWHTLGLIDECRQACGGHGYSLYSGFGKLYTDWVVQCTWEGDNNVLAMNGGRIVIQSIRSALKGKKVSGDMSFINNYKSSMDFKLKDCKDLSELVKLFELCIVKYAIYVNEELKKNNDNWDLFGVEKVAISKLYAHYYSLETMVKKIHSDLGAQGNIKDSLIKLLQVHALAMIEKFSGAFLQFDILDNATLLEIRSTHLKQLYNDLKDKVIGLTDAFLLSDYYINSALGNYNGDFYNDYFTIVKARNDPRIDKPSYATQWLKGLQRDAPEVRERQAKSPEVLAKLGSKF